MNIAAVDLNLLVIFDAVYAEKHISRAGTRIGRSQSAVSNAIARLRLLFNDPLFIKTSSGMRPTARADELAGPIRNAITLIESSLKNPRTFDPSTAERTFVVNMNDYCESILLPRLMDWLTQCAPRVTIQVTCLHGDDVSEGLKAGKIDLAVDCHELDAAGLYKQKLFSDEFACVVRIDHPRIGTRLTRRQFQELSHAAIRPAGEYELIDEILSRKGFKRRSVLDVPHSMIAPLIASTTDLIVVMPKREAMDFARLLSVKVLRPPVSMGRFDVHQYWAEKSHRASANQWLRGALRELSNQMAG